MPAVAEHASSDPRRGAPLPEARDNQHKKVWRSMLGDLTQREDELAARPC
jgi:hypothetical protein